MRLEIQRQAFVQIPKVSQTGAERSMQSGFIGMGELFFELDQVTDHERSNKADVALTEVQLHLDSLLPIRAPSHGIGKSR